MKGSDFRRRRVGMAKTQRQLAEVLGISLRAVHSFEQGWRKVPEHVERQMLLFAALPRRAGQTVAPCWAVTACPPERRKQCPAWEFRAGDLCWFITGTFCRGKAQKTWQRKIKICRRCRVFRAAVGIGQHKAPSRKASRRA